jgi:hypothetical protein
VKSIEVPDVDACEVPETIALLMPLTTKVPVPSGKDRVRLEFEFGDAMVNVPVPLALPSIAILLIFAPYRISQR